MHRANGNNSSPRFSSAFWQHHRPPPDLTPFKQLFLRCGTEVAQMLKDGIIESMSPWSSPIMVAPKPDSSMLCNDFWKCHLGQPRYRKPQEWKVEVMRHYPHPITKEQVCALLGLVGYYRCFVPNFSLLSSPFQI